MAIDYSTFGEKIHGAIIGTGHKNLTLFTADNTTTIDPQDAARFVVIGPDKIVVRWDADNRKVTITSTSAGAVKNLHHALKNLKRYFSSDLNIELKIVGRANDLKAEEQLAVKREKENKMAETIGLDKEVLEGFGHMTGSSKTSYQPLDNIKLVVKHRKPVNEESRGARSRNIHSIYIQRGEERFRLPENNLKAARAMARHVAMGGEVFDTVGTEITEMAKKYSVLQDFVRYTHKSGLINENNAEVVTLAEEECNNIRRKFAGLTSKKTYASTVESIDTRVEALDESDDDLAAKFTETRVDTKISGALPVLQQLVSAKSAYEKRIREYVEAENFDGFSELIQEENAVEFDDSKSSIAHKIARLGEATTNSDLQKYFFGVSKTIEEGHYSSFDIEMVKKALSNVKNDQPRSVTPCVESVIQRYDRFLSEFCKI